jgi:hypothetical protein
MKTLILVAFAVLGLAIGTANAESVDHTAPVQSGTQPTWMSVGAGWG